MNKTEQRYEHHLMQLQRDGKIVWFKYEAIKLKLADKTYLTPDFFVQRPDGTLEIHEIKGAKAIFRDDARVKSKIAAEMYPFKFVVCYPTRSGWEMDEI